jgi:hypothetical protein
VIHQVHHNYLVSLGWHQSRQVLIKLVSWLLAEGLLVRIKPGEPTSPSFSTIYRLRFFPPRLLGRRSKSAYKEVSTDWYQETPISSVLDFLTRCRTYRDLAHLASAALRFLAVCLSEQTFFFETRKLGLLEVSAVLKACTLCATIERAQFRAQM